MGALPCEPEAGPGPTGAGRVGLYAGAIALAVSLAERGILDHLGSINIVLLGLGLIFVGVLTALIAGGCALRRGDRWGLAAIVLGLVASLLLFAVLKCGIPV